MQSCGESASTAGWATTLNNKPTALSTGVDCPPVRGHLGSSAPSDFDQTGLWITERLGNAGGDLEAQYGDRAELTFTPAAGTTISRLRYSRKVYKGVDDTWQPYIAIGSRTNIVDTCEIAGAGACQLGADDWYPNDPDPGDRSTYRDVQDLSAQSIILGLYCRDEPAVHVCGSGDSIPNVEVQIYSAFINISDPSAPTLGTPSGTGWTTSAWARSTLPLSVTSSDNTGISATHVYADGSLIATLQRSCTYTQPRPCTDEPTGSIGLPTAGLADGSHTIQVAAVDASNNETRITRPQALNVDNQPPAAPAGLTSPSSTSTTNNFSAGWTLPSDSGSPIVAARYQLCQNATCGAVQNAPTLTSVSGLTLPAVGSGQLRVWLVDQLGHENAAGPATITLTYQPQVTQPPADPGPQQPTDPGTTNGGTPDPQPVPTPSPVPTPQPPVVKASAALKLTTLRRSGRRVTVGGKLTTKASGRVTIRYRVHYGGRDAVVTRHATIRHGAFRLTFTLSRAIAAVRTAVISVAYGGDADTRAQTRSATLKMRR